MLFQSPLCICDHIPEETTWKRQDFLWHTVSGTAVPQAKKRVSKQSSSHHGSQEAEKEHRKNIGLIQPQRTHPDVTLLAHTSCLSHLTVMLSCYASVKSFIRPESMIPGGWGGQLCGPVCIAGAAFTLLPQHWLASLLGMRNSHAGQYPRWPPDSSLSL